MHVSMRLYISIGIFSTKILKEKLPVCFLSIKVIFPKEFFLTEYENYLTIVYKDTFGISAKSDHILHKIMSRVLCRSQKSGHVNTVL